MTQSTQPGAHKYPPPPPQPQIPPPPPPPLAYPSARPPAPYGYAPAAAPKPPTRWPLSIIAVFFSLLFGVIAMVYSAQVTSKWNAGDVQGAQKASKMALIWGVIGIVVGVILIIAVAGG